MSEITSQQGAEKTEPSTAQSERTSQQGAEETEPGTALSERTSQQCRREQEVSGKRQKYLCEDIQSSKGQNGKGRHQVLQES